MRTYETPYDEYDKWQRQAGVQLHNTELGDATLAEIYAFAGRMRKFLPLCQHEHVGLLAHSLVMRCGRKGISLEEFEQRLIKVFGDKPDIWKDLKCK